MGLGERSGSFAAILAAAWMLRRFLRGLSAKYRHSVLFAGFILLMLWPLLSAVLPVISIQVGLIL